MSSGWETMKWDSRFFETTVLEIFAKHGWMFSNRLGLVGLFNCPVSFAFNVLYDSVQSTDKLPAENGWFFLAFW